jgi:succinate-acetate transporter protein
LALALLASRTHAYLVVMSLRVVFATLAQAVMRRALNWRAAIAVTLGVVEGSGFVGALSGYFAWRRSD